MRFGENFAINYMSRGHKGLWLWLDIKMGRFWYVFMWAKGNGPSLYRSTDATPPLSRGMYSNEGRWYFGRA